MDKRIFLLEPNLKRTFGHVIKFPISIQKVLSRQKIKAIIICNKAAEDTITRHKNIFPLISKTCFENLKDKGRSFFHDLLLIDKKFGLNSRDLVINLTTFTNEVSGIKNYLKLKNSDSPTFCVWFHQLIPPEKIFNTKQKNISKRTLDLLTESFHGINKDKFFLFSTDVSSLRKKLEGLSKLGVHTLPLPYENEASTKKIEPEKGLTFGFLGDGRYEKGLLSIFRYIIRKEDRMNRFIIQDIFPRGYSRKELAEYDTLKAEISQNFKNIKLIHKPLSNLEYDNLLKKIDVNILPYLPTSYNKRSSGVFVEAIINQTPVIATKGTSVANEITKYDLGIVFPYSADVEKSSSNLSEAIRQMKNKYKIFRKKSIIASKVYKKFNSPEYFISSINKIIKLHE